MQKFHHYYGDDFKIECPTGSGRSVSIDEAASEIAARLTRIFLRDDQGNRPVFSQYPRLQTDAYFRDHVMFYEYFHGDSGRGVGAFHQTGDSLRNCCSRDGDPEHEHFRKLADRLSDPARSDCLECFGSAHGTCGPAVDV